MNKNQLVKKIQDALIEQTCQIILKNENTTFTKLYKEGLITGIELIENSLFEKSWNKLNV